MLHYDKGGVSEGTNINKKKCIKRMGFLSLLFFSMFPMDIMMY